MGPHAKHFDDAFVFHDLIDQTMANINTAGVKNGGKWRGFDFSARAYCFCKPLLLKDLLAFTSATLDQASATVQNQHPV
jgi:hypothetical protein